VEESSGQQEVLTSAEMQKEDVQAEAWGDRQTKKKKYTFDYFYKTYNGFH
jgi:hypothetical protein